MMKRIVVVFTLLLLIVQITNAISINEIKSGSKVVSDGMTLGMSTGFQWPLYGHDAQNTCLSEYDASQNQGYEKWKYYVDASPDLITPIIDGNGIIYITSNYYEGLYAIYSNGTLKWRRDLIGSTAFQPALGLDGTIYAGTNERFHAFYPNGTLRWILPMEKYFCSDPVVSPESIVYIGTIDGFLYAVYPNGTIQWEYYLGYRIIATSLDAQGNIYFTALSCNYLYCLNPNGTLRWRFEEIRDIHDAPLIGDDGTIYIVPEIEVVAINPDGTEKWRTPVNCGIGLSPSLSPNGPIIVSSHDLGYVWAIDPDDGHILWTYVMGDPYDKTRAAVSSDGTIFFAYSGGYIAYLNALNPDGTLRWTSRITSDSYPYDILNLGPAPSISADGTVYVTTGIIGGEPNFSFGYVHAFGQLDSNAPTAPIITGPPQGKIRQQYEYIFTSTSPTGKNLSYFVYWNDDTNTNWTALVPSGQPVRINHTWSKRGTYTIQARAKDADNLWGPWGTMEVTMPLSYEPPQFRFIEWLLERFPNAFPILRYLLGN